MDTNSINIVFNQIIAELSNPILDIDNLVSIISFIKNDLISLYENNKSVIDGITYFNNMIIEIVDNNNILNNNVPYGIVLIVDKYLVVNDDNLNILNSTFIIIQSIFKACVHQLWQQLFKFVNNRNVTIDDIVDANNLFNTHLSDIMFESKKCIVTKL